MDGHGNFLSVREFNLKFGTEVNCFIHTFVVAAIRGYIEKTNLAIGENNLNDIGVPINIEKVYKSKLGSKDYYNVLLPISVPPKCCQGWEDTIFVNIPWKNIFFKIHKIQDINLKWLQVRIVHRILGTNIVLNKMNIANSELCNYCGIERDSIVHTLFNCQSIQPFWNTLENAVNNKCQHALNVKFSQRLILFGVDRQQRTDDILDLIILLAKSFVYKCKQSNIVPNLNQFINVLRFRYKMEEFNAKMLNNMHAFRQSWVHYKPLIFDD